MSLFYHILSSRQQHENTLLRYPVFRKEKEPAGRKSPGSDTDRYPVQRKTAGVRHPDRKERLMEEKYSSIRIDRIGSIDDFFKVVDRCSQPVYMESEDRAFDLKNDPSARKVMRSVCSRDWRGLLSLRVGGSDMNNMLCYMMGQ
jgi:hypothetical protein